MSEKFVTSAADILQRSAHGTPLLMYHKIGPQPWRAQSRALYVSPQLLRRQLGGLLRAGRQAVNPGDVRTAARAFSVTIDDAFACVQRHGLPILQEFGICATLFVVAGMLGETNQWDPERLMDKSEIREWLAAGQKIGSHTLTHPRLTQLGAGLAREEISASRKLLEDEFGVSVKDFCYPYGDQNPVVCDLVAAAGYETGCTVESRAVTASDNPFRLPRLLARYRWPGPKAVLTRIFGRFGRQ